MKTIILGPPGTGKTTTLLNLVDQFIQQGIRPKQIKIEEKKIEEAFPAGPPCLNKLASTGFGEGSRNNALFNIAVYYKQAHLDRDWETLLLSFSLRF